MPVIDLQNANIIYTKIFSKTVVILVFKFHFYTSSDLVFHNLVRA